MSRQFSDVPKLDKYVAVYLAGLIDGEASFWMGKSYKQEMANNYAYSASFKLVLVHEPTIKWVSERLNIGYRRQTGNPSKNHQDTYEIRTGQVDFIVKFIPQILPYMITKREVASTILEYCLSRQISRGIKYNAPYTEDQLGLYHKIKQLNRVGRPVAIGGYEN